MNCPLCESVQINNLEEINKDDLTKLYKKMTGVDFSYLINKNINFCECGNCKLRFYDPLITGDEKFYNSFQKFDWYYMDEKDEYLEAKKYINSTDKVLEVGSGKGAFAKHLTSKDYIGLDSSKNAKLMAAKNGIHIENEMIQDYVKKHPDSFDVVASFQVLEHVSAPLSFIQAKVDALKVGGKMIVAVPSQDSFLKYAVNNILNMPPHHVTRWPDETLQFVADKYNLDLVTIYHEKLQNVHKLWFVKVLVDNSFMAPKLLSSSLIYRLISKVSSILARVLVRGLMDEMLPAGHTVIAVYQKK